MVGREYPDRPLVGVGGVVVRADWRVLLVRRGREPGKGLWSLPGGLVEAGETAAAALRREIEEECAIEVEVADWLGIIEPRIWDEQGRLRFHYVIVDFLALYRSGQAHADSDVDDVRWVEPQQIAQYELNRPETGEMIERGLAAYEARIRREESGATAE